MRAKGDIGYAVTYTDKEGNTVSWHGQTNLDYFYARYCFIVLTDAGEDRYKNLKLRRYTHKGEGEEPLVEVIEPVLRSDFDARYAVFGTKSPLLDARYCYTVRTEGEADAYGRGIELGIARSATFLQFAAANTHSSVGDVLDEYAEELLIHAPSYHARYHSLTEVMRKNAQLEKELAYYKELATTAKAEYHERLGVKPQFGMMDLPLTRKMLETITE